MGAVPRCCGPGPAPGAATTRTCPSPRWGRTGAASPPVTSSRTASARAHPWPVCTSSAPLCSCWGSVTIATPHCPWPNTGPAERRGFVSQGRSAPRDHGGGQAGTADNRPRRRVVYPPAHHLVLARLIPAQPSEYRSGRTGGAGPLGRPLVQRAAAGRSRQKTELHGGQYLGAVAATSSRPAGVGGNGLEYAPVRFADLACTAAATGQAGAHAHC